MSGKQIKLDSRQSIASSSCHLLEPSHLIFSLLGLPDIHMHLHQDILKVSLRRLVVGSVLLLGGCRTAWTDGASGGHVAGGVRLTGWG